MKAIRLLNFVAIISTGLYATTAIAKEKSVGQVLNNSSQETVSVAQQASNRLLHPCLLTVSQLNSANAQNNGFRSVVFRSSLLESSGLQTVYNGVKFGVRNNEYVAIIALGAGRFDKITQHYRDISGTTSTTVITQHLAKQTNASCSGSSTIDTQLQIVCFAPNTDSEIILDNVRTQLSLVPNSRCTSGAENCDNTECTAVNIPEPNNANHFTYVCTGKAQLRQDIESFTRRPQGSSNSCASESIFDNFARYEINSSCLQANCSDGGCAQENPAPLAVGPDDPPPEGPNNGGSILQGPARVADGGPENGGSILQGPARVADGGSFTGGCPIFGETADGRCSRIPRPCDGNTDEPGTVATLSHDPRPLPSDGVHEPLDDADGQQPSSTASAADEQVGV